MSEGDADTHDGAVDRRRRWNRGHIVMLGVVEGDEREKRTMMCTILDVCCVSLKQDKYYIWCVQKGAVVIWMEPSDFVLQNHNI